jgi:hypothetical protein
MPTDPHKEYSVRIETDDIQQAIRSLGSALYLLTEEALAQVTTIATNRISKSSPAMSWGRSQDMQISWQAQKLFRGSQTEAKKMWPRNARPHSVSYSEAFSAREIGDVAHHRVDPKFSPTLLKILHPEFTQRLPIPDFLLSTVDSKNVNRHTLQIGYQVPNFSRFKEVSTGTMSAAFRLMPWVSRMSEKMMSTLRHPARVWKSWDATTSEPKRSVPLKPRNKTAAALLPRLN